MVDRILYPPACCSDLFVGSPFEPEDKLLFTASSVDKVCVRINEAGQGHIGGRVHFFSGIPGKVLPDFIDKPICDGNINIRSTVEKTGFGAAGRIVERGHDFTAVF
jgi:hypothetical protein